MIRALAAKRHGPIGVDIGSRSIKLMQLTADRSGVVDMARADLPTTASSWATEATSSQVGSVGNAAAASAGPSPTESEPDEERSKEGASTATASANDAAHEVIAALGRARQARNFRGREAILCLGEQALFVQNIRVPRATGKELDDIVRQEARGRLPFDADNAEIRYLDAADVRQGDVAKREVILLASPRPAIDRLIHLADFAGLRPVAIDPEPLALLRCYSRQFRRDDDRQQRMMFVHLGAAKTLIVIAQGLSAKFVKYVDVGGQHFDEAVARDLRLPLKDAIALRRHVADRAGDPEIAQSITEAVRGVVGRLADELSLCVRYHSVAFRGQRLSRIVLGGGDADPALAHVIQDRLDIPCELSDPFRTIRTSAPVGRVAQWAIAAGLALRDG